jgi:hypothetical protein
MAGGYLIADWSSDFVRCTLARLLQLDVGGG